MGIKCEIPKEFCNVRSADGFCTINQQCEPIIDKCEGCAKIENGYCKLYIRPSVKWRISEFCPAATHIYKNAEYKAGKRRVGQQKQKKRR